MSGIQDLKQPTYKWLADVIDNIDVLQKLGGEPAMDITVHGVTFEFRVKPEELTKQTTEDK